MDLLLNDDGYLMGRSKMKRRTNQKKMFKKRKGKSRKRGFFFSGAGK